MTSGIAPTSDATNGVSHAISSAVGREKPSYREGTHATSAEPMSRMSSAWSMPETKVTESAMPR